MTTENSLDSVAVATPVNRLADHTTTTTTTTASWNESAYDWLMRSRRQRKRKRPQQNTVAGTIPSDPSSAAWSFVQRLQYDRVREAGTVEQDCGIGTGTGITFIDFALSRRGGCARNSSSTPSSSSLPVIDVRGEYGKTWTLISLVARFVVATCPSRCSDYMDTNNYDNSEQAEEDGLLRFPQAFIIDSKLDITISKITYAVRSCLLRELSTNSTSSSNDHHEDANSQSRLPSTEINRIQFHKDMENCLRRIHFIKSSSSCNDDTISSGYIPPLELVRNSLHPYQSDHPTLIVWDGFLCSMSESDAGKMEVVRSVELLLQQCSIFLVLTSDTMYRKRDHERFITHRIYLEQNQGQQRQHDHEEITSEFINQSEPSLETIHKRRMISNNSSYVATVYGTQIPFSISLAGILS